VGTINEALAFFFLDGVGIGADDPASNPFLEAKTPTWRALAGDDWPTLRDQTPRQTGHATLLGADATLGVAGIPQSGTGTTALLTGKNAPAILGRHDGPYPPSKIRPLLQEHNLLSRVSAQNGRCAFANAYPPFFTLNESNAGQHGVPLAYKQLWRRGCRYAPMKI